jgi:hypothetical protein
MKLAFRVAWSRAAERSVRGILASVQRVPPLSVSWRRLRGPFFGNEVATLVLDGARAEVVFQRSDPDGSGELIEVTRLDLTGARGG